MEAVDEALPDDLVGPVVAGTAAAHRIARAVAEGGDAGPVQRALRRLDEAPPIGHLAEVPAFADQVDVAPGGSVDGGLQAFHGRARLVAHQVEAERVDAVVACPDDRRVDHQLGHHGVLGRGVGAAGRALDRAVGVEAVVVARHDAVEHRLGMLAGGGRVVVDHVHADAQPEAVQRLHHARGTR